MDPRLLEYYNRELRFVREMGGEFAREFPKIAGRLGLESFECADPYVERLLEGFAFLAARVQLKIDAEFPAFTQHLLEMVYPHYLAPTPSMAVVELQPVPDEGALVAGFDIPRDTVLRSTLGKGEQTACEYRTGHQVRLWPLELTAAEYFSHTGPVAKADLNVLKRSKAGIRLRLRTTANLSFAQLALGQPERFSLVLFLQGAD
ncbi:MAG: type VI secretion system baseplate subunit TssF [Chromatiaceae bacterium]